MFSTYSVTFFMALIGSLLYVSNSLQPAPSGVAAQHDKYALRARIYVGQAVTYIAQNTITPNTSIDPTGSNVTPGVTLNTLSCGANPCFSALVDSTGHQVFITFDASLNLTPEAYLATSDGSEIIGRVSAPGQITNPSYGNLSYPTLPASIPNGTTVIVLSK